MYTEPFYPHYASKHLYISVLLLDVSSWVLSVFQDPSVHQNREYINLPPYSRVPNDPTEPISWLPLALNGMLVGFSGSIPESARSKVVVDTIVLLEESSDEWHGVIRKSCKNCFGKFTFCPCLLKKLSTRRSYANITLRPVGGWRPAPPQYVRGILQYSEQSSVRSRVLPLAGFVHLYLKSHCRMAQ